MTPNPALETAFAAEHAARLAQALEAIAQGDAAALALSVHRAQRAARAIGAALGAEWDGVLQTLERARAVERAFARERTLALEGSRLERAERAAGVGASPVRRAPLPSTDLPTAAPRALSTASSPVDSKPVASSAGNASPANSSATSAPRREPEETVRVGVSKLDALLALAGELRVAQIRFEEHLAPLRATLAELQAERRAWRRRGSNAAVLAERARERLRDRAAHLSNLERAWARDAAHLHTLVQDVEDEVLKARLLPAAMLLPPLERLVRDLGAQLGKRVVLVGTGSDVEMDRRIVDAVRDPLMHMIRNSLDHGIEDEATRVARGKDAQAQITLAFSSEGGALLITLRDDGAGINLDAVRTRGLERGLLDGTEPPERVAETIFEPGFSTAAAVTDTSGRGVGMDVVRENLRALGGSVGVATHAGQGTTFTLRVPVQLATTRVLLVRVGEHVVALPTLEVARTGRTQAQALREVGRASTLSMDGGVLRVAELAAVLEVTRDEPGDWQPFVVIGAERARVALFVDELLNEQEVVVKRLGFPFEAHAHLIGAAVLGSGRLVPILSPSALKDRFEQRGAATVALKTRASQTRAAPRKRVLVVDDSVTTRTLERSILEASGFETRTAMDGLQALEVLRSDAIDLVLSDVEMPHLDGFGLTAEIRADRRIAHIPVILVTSLNAPEHRERGASAGADAYIVKGEFDQGTLLQTIGRLL